MTAAYESGTVAVATVRGLNGVRVFRCFGGWTSEDSTPNGFDFHADEYVTDVRPLVVLDPEGEGFHVAEMAADLRKRGQAWLADQIEAQTKPPKPAEPTGLGAVVEDASGKRFVRYDGDWPWLDGTANLQWQHINAVRVLSEGVPA